MQLLVTFLVMLVAVTFGMPYDPSVNSGTSFHVNSLQLKNESGIIHYWENVGCDYVDCITSLAGTTGACGAAAAEEGLNVFADLQCLSSIGQDVTGDSCSNCVTSLGRSKWDDAHTVFLTIMVGSLSSAFISGWI